MSHRIRLLIWLLVISPGFWWPVTQPGNLVKEWVQSPAYFRSSFANRINGPYLDRLRDMQWGGWLIHRNSLLPKLVYSYPMLLINEFIELVEFAQPRMFFVTGDGSNFSPPSLQPIPVVLFPFWFIGLLNHIKTKHWSEFVLLFIFTSIAYLIGQKNLAFLLPVLVIYLRWASQGLDSLSTHKNIATAAVSFYSLYAALGSVWFGFR